MSHRLTLPMVRYGALALVGLAVLAPACLGNGFALYMATIALVYGLLAVGLSLYLAAGLLDLGFVAFFAIGAFGTVIGFRHELPFAIMLPLICLINAGLAAFLAFAAGRSRGDYFAVVTLAFGEMIRIVIRNESALTGGPQGLSLPPGQAWAAWLVGDPRRSLAVIGALAFVGAGTAQSVLRSSTGYAALFCREQEEGFRTGGLSPLRVRLKMALLGSLLATCAGVFFGIWQGYVSPSSFGFFESLTVLVIVILGSGTRAYIPGVLLAAGLVMVVPELLKVLGEYRMLIFGILVLGVTLLLPTGLLGLDWARWENLALLRRPRRGTGRQPNESGAPPRQSRELIVEKITARYPTSGYPILKDLSYRFRPDRLHGLIGYNGSGKTTLLRALLAFADLEISGGRVLLGSEEIRSASGRNGVASPLFGACLQRLSLVPFLSTFQHAMALTGDTVGRLESRCEQLGEQLGLARDRLFTPVSELGTFERRLAELLLALLRDPRALLLDEPMAGFSDAEADTYYRTVRALAAGMVVVFIEHAQRTVRKHADTVLFMNNGSLVVGRTGEAGALERDPATGNVLAAGSYDEVARLDVMKDYLGSQYARPERAAAELASQRAPVLRARIEEAGYESAPGVLRQIEMEVGAGEVVFLTGLNGAGKSTLLRVLGRRPEVTRVRGLLAWRSNDHGELDLLAVPPHGPAGIGLAMVLEGIKAFPSLSVEENLALGGVGDRGDRLDRDIVLGLFRGPLAPTFFGAGATPGESDIQAVLRKPAEALSGGQQQAISVMRAVLHARVRLGRPGERSLMLLDEPSAGIQQSTVRSIYQVIFELHASAQDRFQLIATEQSQVFEEFFPHAVTAMLAAGETLALRRPEP